MTTLTLLVKALHSAQLKQIDDLLKSQFEDLDVEVDVLGNTVNRWLHKKGNRHMPHNPRERGEFFRFKRVHFKIRH